MTAATVGGPRVELRAPQESDAEECGRIVYEAFNGISDLRSFPREFESVETATALIAARIAHPSIFGVVAERDGRVLGSNFLDERDPIRGVGPTTVDPREQGSGVGRRLMEAVIERGREAAGVRLMQDAHNPVSLSLYASVGFVVREPTVWMRGRATGEPPDAHGVRPLDESDLDACDRLCTAVHGFARSNELRDALRLPALTPFVAVRDGRVRAYASSVGGPYQRAHGVAETDADLATLILGATARPEPITVDFLVPVRRTELFRWCLAHGLRAVKPMTLMTIGDYREPTGSWLPSVLY